MEEPLKSSLYMPETWGFLKAGVTSWTHCFKCLWWGQWTWVCLCMVGCVWMWIFSPKDSKTATLVDFLEINCFGWHYLDTGERHAPTKIPSNIPLFFEKMILFCVYVSLTQTEDFIIIIFYCTISSAPTLVASLFKREQRMAVARKDTSDCEYKQICYMLGLKRTIGVAAASHPDQIKRGDRKSRQMIIKELHKNVQILCGDIAQDNSS